MNQEITLKAAVLIITSLALALLGMCVGFIWGLSFRLVPQDPGATSLWALGWTVIGSVQGACVAPAFILGRRGDLRAWAALVLGSGCLTTSLVALCLFFALGHGGGLALALALGLSVMGAAPLIAYLLGQRELTPGLPLRI